MDLKDMKLDGLVKLQEQNATALKANKEAITKLGDVKKGASASIAALKTNSKDLSTVDD